jgi:hypothetical protein
MKKSAAVEFDTFSYYCPFFDKDDDINGGYGCKCEGGGDGNHDENGVWHRMCTDAECTICSTVDREDLERDDVNWDGCKPEEDDPGMEYGETGISIVSLGPESGEEGRQAWLAYQQYLNRYNENWKPRKPWEETK